jgi:tetratricopeptide (TPR) repeat protein
MHKGFFLAMAVLLSFLALTRPGAYAQNEEALRFRSQIEHSLKKSELRKALAQAEEYTRKYPRDYMSYQFKARALYELSTIDGAQKCALKAVALNRED